MVAGLDELGGGTWLGLNDFGVVAGVLNRLNTLGPAPGLRSRGELPLLALDHGAASAAVEAIAELDPDSYRPFNMVIADRREAFWLRTRAAGIAPGPGPHDGGGIEIAALPAGLSMITAYDRNDVASPRIRRYLPLFEAAAAPDPDRDDWSEWRALLASREHDPAAGPGGACWVATTTGFGTVSSSLIALPAAGTSAAAPRWLFSAGHLAARGYHPVSLAATTGER